MESTKQQGTIVYFNKKDKTKTSETDYFPNGNEASISRVIVSVEQTTKRTCADKSMSQKEVRNKRICQAI